MDRPCGLFLFVTMVTGVVFGGDDGDFCDGLGDGHHAFLHSDRGDQGPREGSGSSSSDAHLARLGQGWKLLTLSFPACKAIKTCENISGFIIITQRATLDFNRGMSLCKGGSKRVGNT